MKEPRWSDFTIEEEVEELELVQLSTGEVVQYETINNQINEETENND
jgi:hypothetical protein